MSQKLYPLLPQQARFINHVPAHPACLRWLCQWPKSPIGHERSQPISRLAKLTLVAVMPFVEMEAGAVEMGYIGQVNEPLLEEDLRLFLKTGVQTLQGWSFQAYSQLL